MSSKRKTTNQESGDHKLGEQQQESPQTRAWRLAKLAAMLAPKTFLTAHAGDHQTLEIIRARSPEGDILNVLNNETAFEYLLDGADYLLTAAERRSGVQQASQLFRGGPEFLAVDAIANVFRRHRWKGLKSNETVQELLYRVLNKLAEMDRLARAKRSDNELKFLPAVPSVLEFPLWPDPEIESAAKPDGDGQPAGHDSTSDAKAHIPATAEPDFLQWADRAGLRRTEAGTTRYWVERIFILARIAGGDAIRRQLERVTRKES